MARRAHKAELQILLAFVLRRLERKKRPLSLDCDFGVYGDAGERRGEDCGDYSSVDFAYKK